MAYSDTQVYALTAGAATPSGIVTALHTHFDSAPGRWGVVSGASLAAGESTVIERDTGGDSHVTLKSRSTTDLCAAVDPGEATTDGGDASTDPTGSDLISPECRSGTLPTFHVDFLLIEHDLAITVLLLDAARTYIAAAIHAGNIYTPLRPNWADLGASGHGALVGAVTDSFVSGRSSWFYTSEQTNGCRVRAFDTSGAAHWVGPTTEGSPFSTVSRHGSTNEDGTVRPMYPMFLSGVDVNGSLDARLGLMRYVSFPPTGSTLAAQYPLVMFDSGVDDDESWLTIANSYTTSTIAVSWERGVNP